MGPILFLIYTSAIGDILRRHAIDFHLYADDTQLYISFETSSVAEFEAAKLKVESCVGEIDEWMSRNKLKLNTDKTEVLVLSAAHRPRPPSKRFTFSDNDICPASTVCDIGVILDEKLSLENHVINICKSCFSIFTIYGKFINISHLKPVKLLFMHLFLVDLIFVILCCMAYPNL